MARSIGFSIAVAVLLVSPVSAQHGGGHMGGGHMAGGMAHPAAEPHPGPSGYQRVTEPRGWNARPTTINRQVFNHNFQAARTYHIGPYHPPQGWAAHRWRFGQILPGAYWTANYLLADYWLFGLEVPPVGAEWVRDGDDAILVNTTTGEILQVEYDVFA